MYDALSSLEEEQHENVSKKLNTASLSRFGHNGHSYGTCQP